jgi:hypothetical protein
MREGNKITFFSSIINIYFQLDIINSVVLITSDGMYYTRMYIIWDSRMTQRDPTATQSFWQVDPVHGLSGE